jgi:hypothetical protein
MIGLCRGEACKDRSHTYGAGGDCCRAPRDVPTSPRVPAFAASTRETAETRRSDASGQNVANVRVHHAEVGVLGRVHSHEPGSARHVGVLSDDL